ncbi:MAG TPA: DinB family protein [Steroidobacteraceae bacterium]|jgi:uncharacterized damage-inducible protein DinB
MNSHPYSHLVGYKQWADRGLFRIVGEKLSQLDSQDAANLLRVLDHMHVVDRIFQHHLQGQPHGFEAPRSKDVPDIGRLIADAMAVDDWYVSYVGTVSGPDFEQPVDFVLTNGAPVCMTRGEILLHVCMHGTYHRGNAGILLLKNGIAPNDDRMTDFLQAAA